MIAQGRKRGRRSRRMITEISEATIRLHVEPLAEGGYLATSPDVPGLVAEGRSVTEAVEIAQGLTRKIVESCLEHGDPLPPALAKLAQPPLDLLVPVGVRCWGALLGSSTAKSLASFEPLALFSIALVPVAITRFGGRRSRDAK